MARVIVITLFCVCFGVWGGSSATASDGDRKISVYASIYPMYDFSVKIGGERVNVINMVPSGVEPHDWEPAAADIAGLEEASVFVYNGAGMESWVPDVLGSLRNKKLVSVEASGGIKLMEGHHHEDGEEEHEEHEEEGGDYDPHVWLSPMNAKTIMNNIRNALAAADPDGEAYYKANYDRYAAECDLLDKEFESALSGLSKKDIIVTHQAFGYMCVRYGLNQIPIAGLSPDSEPDPARMAEIIDFTKKNGVKVVFFEELASPKVAESIAASTGARTDMLSPIEGLDDEEAAAGEDYFSIMRKNLKSLVAALQ